MLIQVVEPTLRDETGHCYSYITSLLEASKEINLNLELWIARKTQVVFDLPFAMHHYFLKRCRRLQQFWLYFRFLLKHQPFFVQTAGRVDLIILHILSKFGLLTNKVFLHFHQFRKTEKKLKQLRSMHQLHNNVKIFTPTDGLSKIFQNAGFKQVIVVPCFSFQCSTNLPRSDSFRKLLFAGAARADKGFSVVVDFIAYLIEKRINIPFDCQISPPHSGRYDAQSKLSLTKLNSLSASWLTLYKTSLNKQKYLALFEGAICLLPYDPTAYSDKFSAVLLDALLAGCPVIVSKNTWMSEIVQRFGAGITIHDNTPLTLLAAVEKIIDNYEIYRNKASDASEILRLEHSPKKVLEAIVSLTG